MPCLASRSRCGVSTSLFPCTAKSIQPRSSAMMKRMLGFVSLAETKPAIMRK